MKKLLKALIVSLFLGAGSLLVVYIINTNFIQEKAPEISQNELIAKISGAVEKPGDYLFVKNQTIREIIFKAKVKKSADIQQLNLDEKQTDSFEIIVPYKAGEVPKLRYSEIKTVTQLKLLGIKENVAKVIIKHKNENKEIPTWEEIDDLPGIGQKTLLYLKELIDLS